MNSAYEFIKKELEGYKGILVSRNWVVKAVELRDNQWQSQLKKDYSDAKVYGLFLSMIGDIPKHKRDAHQKKMEWLEEKGFIKPIDLSE